MSMWCWVSVILDSSLLLGVNSSEPMIGFSQPNLFSVSSFSPIWVELKKYYGAKLPLIAKQEYQLTWGVDHTNQLQHLSSASLAVIMWKAVGHRLFLNIILNNFTTGTTWHDPHSYGSHTGGYGHIGWVPAGPPPPPMWLSYRHVGSTQIMKIARFELLPPLTQDKHLTHVCAHATISSSTLSVIIGLDSM